MKKIVLLLTFLLSLSYLSVNADECSQSCKLTEWTPAVLENYISDLRIVIWNLTLETQQVEANTWISKDLKELKSQMIGLYNLAIDWSWYFSYFEFFVVYPISNEYVPEIWRDYQMLDIESKWIERYKKALVTRWLSSVEITKEKLCKWVENKNCNLEWWNILEVLAEIEKNHEKVKDYFRLSILWKKWQFTWWDIMFVEKNFKEELSKHYNENTTKECSLCEWWFFDRIEKSIDKVMDLQNLWKEWIKQWQDAISMFNDSWNWKLDERKERAILQEELWRQWLSSWQADAILNNLDRYNSWWWFSLKNNFITNSFNYLKDSVVSQSNTFYESVLKNFNSDKILETFWFRDRIPIKNITATDASLKTTQEIQQRIDLMYKKELPFAQMQDVSNEALQSKIIYMHYNLSQAIKVLDQTVETSEKVCNKQATWRWNCSYK